MRLQDALRALFNTLEKGQLGLIEGGIAFVTATRQVEILGDFDATTNPPSGAVTSVALFASFGGPELLPVISATELGFDLSDFFAARRAEKLRADNVAIEKLFLDRDWAFHGGGGADVLLRTARSADGFALNFKGDDSFNLLGGADEVFAGAGNDTVSGGKGRDTLDGGKGRDWLDGGDEADTLRGGNQADTMDGGPGDDTLVGGGGADLMRGGGGADSFDFRSLVGDAARDVILGFQLGLDKLDFGSTPTDADIGYRSDKDTRGVLIRYDGGSVYLLGLTRQERDVLLEHKDDVFL
jgi:Ca2+-binding RTX toxin-like protein